MIKVDKGLLKWLSMVFDTYNGDFYFPWNNIDKYISTHNETHNSEYIKEGIKNIQKSLIENNGGDMDDLFEKEFGE